MYFSNASKIGKMDREYVSVAHAILGFGTFLLFHVESTRDIYF